MKIEDPLEYKNSAYGQRLEIAKYIIIACGDDFNVPDNSRSTLTSCRGKNPCVWHLTVGTLASMTADNELCESNPAAAAGGNNYVESLSSDRR